MRAVLFFTCLTLATSGPALAGSQQYCESEARAFADSYVGDRDMMTSLLQGGLDAAVLARGWFASPRTVERAARAGAASAYAGSMAQDPRVWQGLYDTAYQTCMAGQSNGSGGAPSSVAVDQHTAPSQGCRSRAGVVGSQGGGGTISASSSATGCR